MNGYCNGCDVRCPMDALRCGRGRQIMEAVGYGMENDGPAGEMTGGGRSCRGFDGNDAPHGFGGHREGPGFGRPGHGGHGHGGPGMPPHGGRPPFGRPPRPMPDGELLRERIGNAGLMDLLAMAGRLMHHRPGAGAARGQQLILSILAGREGISQRELQQMLGVQPGSMSEIVSKLEKKDLVSREKGEDRRGNLLRITDAGRQMIAGSTPTADDAAFEALDASERETLARLLRVLLTDWAGRLERGPQPGGQFRTMPFRPPETDGRFDTMPIRPPETDGRFQTLPVRPAEADDGMDHRGFPTDGGVQV